MATRTLAFVKGAYVEEANPNTHYTFSTSSFYEITGNENNNTRKRVYLAFESFPSSLKHNSISSVKIYIRGKASYSTGHLTLGSTTDFNANTLTFNTAPDYDPSYARDIVFFDSQLVSGKDICPDQDANSISYDETAARIVGRPYLCATQSKTYSWNDDSLRVGLIGGGNARLEVTYSDTTKQTSQVVYKSGPKSGYSNPRDAISFQWDLEPASSSVYCADPTFAQASATFYWKKSTDESYTAVAISGSQKNVTISANTFPTASTIQWYVSATDEDGTTTTTSVYSFSTTAGAASASCVSPVNSVEDGSAPIQFLWTLSSTDGQQPSRTRVVWRKASDPDEQANYHVITDVNEAITNVTVAGGTFPAGEIFWQVRVWNIDGTEGTRSNATFICVAAPDPVEGLSATDVPRTTISWQSEEQQAYEISIDGETVQRAFGASVYSWQVVEPLEDGDHVISVRVQGIYGFWSQPSEVTITVANSVPAAWSDITLTGDFDIDAYLSLTSPGNGITVPVSVQWYRDGVRIADVYYGTGYGGSVFSHADIRTLGTHQYYAELWDDDGNYARSNTVSGTLSVVSKHIRALHDPDGYWMELKLTDKSNGTESYQTTQQKASQHVNGAVWPDLDVSPFRDLSASYDCAFRIQDEAREFEALFGKVVVMKSRGDEVVIGMLSQIQKKVSLFYTTYSFSINQIHVDDFTEETA